MHLKLIVLFLLGITLALAGGVGSFKYVRAIEDELAAARRGAAALEDMEEVVIARQQIPRGSLPGPEAFDKILLPARLLPPSIMRRLDPLPEGEDQTYVALSEIAEGDLVLASSIATGSRGAGTGLVLSIDAKAFAIRPRNLESLAGQLAPDIRIDLFWTRDIGGGSTETRLLATGLRVLSQPMPVQGTAGSASQSADSVAADLLLVEGFAADVARYIQAEPRGDFDIALSEAPLSLNATEVVIGPETLKTLPLAVRERQTRELSAQDIVTQITAPNAQRVCPTIIVRAAKRTVVEVPC